MNGKRLLTSVVGSYPQPDWLIDREALRGRLPPRVRASELWRVPEQFLHEAQDDATQLAIHDMERAGVDIISDGEARRESYSNRFAASMEGVDVDNPGTALDRTGRANPVPRVTGPIRRAGSVQVRDVEFLRGHTKRRIKVTIPGPFTATQQAQNDYYTGEEKLALAYAEVINEEIHDLFAAGADVVQLDEPYLQARPEKAREYAIKSINRALEGIEGTTAIHLCFGYAYAVREKPSGYSFLLELEKSKVQQVSIEAAQPKLDLSVLKQLSSKTILLGVLDLGDMNVESGEIVAKRIREALNYIPPERLVVAPDCGMKYLPRDVAFGKLVSMVEGTKIVRRELE